MWGCGAAGVVNTQGVVVPGTSDPWPAVPGHPLPPRTPLAAPPGGLIIPGSPLPTVQSIPGVTPVRVQQIPQESYVSTQVKRQHYESSYQRTGIVTLY